MRVAIAGSHATGKSSLALELAQQCPSLTAIEEPYYLLESEGYVFADPPTVEDFERLTERSIELLAATPRGDAVVFDRSPADYIAYLAACSRGQVPRELLAAVAQALTTLDLVIFVPIERPDRVAGAEAPRLRRRVDGILRTMLLEEAWGFQVPVLVVRGTVADRVAQVAARIAPWRADMPAAHAPMSAQSNVRCS
jgi:predicted ATPase